jgi:hypothetical protein
MSFTAGGVPTASDTTALVREHGGSSSTGYIQGSATYLVSSLTAGSNTFTAVYRKSSTTANTCIFANRNIIVIPLP